MCIHVVCMCVCMCAFCVHLCIYVCMRTYISVYVCMHACMYVCMYVRICVVCMCACMYVYMHACMHELPWERATGLHAYTHAYLVLLPYVCVWSSAQARSLCASEREQKGHTSRSCPGKERGACPPPLPHISKLECPGTCPVQTHYPEYF